MKTACKSTPAVRLHTTTRIDQTGTSTKKPAARYPLAFAALLAIGAAIPNSSHAGTFSDSLTNGLNPNDYTVTQSAAGVYTEDPSDTGIQLAKVESTSGFQEIDINLNLSALGGNVTGDFSVQIDFANALIGPNDDQIQLNTSYANGAGFDDVYDLSSGLNVHVYDGLGIENPQPVSTNNGTFIVSRTGSTVTGTIDGLTIFPTRTRARWMPSFFHSRTNRTRTMIHPR